MVERGDEAKASSFSFKPFGRPPDTKDGPSWPQRKPHMPAGGSERKGVQSWPVAQFFGHVFAPIITITHAPLFSSLPYTNHTPTSVTRSQS